MWGGVFNANGRSDWLTSGVLMASAIAGHIAGGLVTSLLSDIKGVVV